MHGNKREMRVWNCINALRFYTSKLWSERSSNFQHNYSFQAHEYSSKFFIAFYRELIIKLKNRYVCTDAFQFSNVVLDREEF